MDRSEAAARSVELATSRMRPCCRVRRCDRKRGIGPADATTPVWCKRSCQRTADWGAVRPLVPRAKHQSDALPKQ